MKAVMFDFDGTLTCKSPNIWKAIWKSLGYDTGKDSYFAQLYTKFISKQISYQQWCDLTCEAFENRDMNKDTLNKLSEDIKLIKGAENVFKELKMKGISLNIISGNISQVIKKVLGKNIKYFDIISANSFYFNPNNYLTYIKGTSYDFEGKAKFINEFKERTGISGKDICFVGNGDNDEWAHLSGCKTVCINPENADVNNSTKWHKVAFNVQDLREIVQFLDSDTAADLSK